MSLISAAICSNSNCRNLSSDGKPPFTNFSKLTARNRKQQAEGRRRIRSVTIIIPIKWHLVGEPAENFRLFNQEHVRIGHVCQVAPGRGFTQIEVNQIVQVTHPIIERILVRVVHESRRKMPGLGEGGKKSIERSDVRPINVAKLDSGWWHKRRGCHGVYAHAGSLISGLQKEVI